jgi:RNA polymerase sigma factor (sigma-70 family)
MSAYETKLIQQAQEGNALALARLHDIYYQDVYRYYYYRVEGEAFIEDLTAGLFNRMAERISLFKLESGPFRTWLFGLARSLMLEELLKVGLDYREITFHHYTGESWGQPAGRLKRRLAQLNPEERDILVGKLIENRPTREVGREVGHAAGAVLTLQGNALAKLAQAELGADEPEEVRRRFCRQLDEVLIAEGEIPTEADLIARYPKFGARLAPLIAQAREIRATPDPEPPAIALSASKIGLMDALGEKKALGIQNRIDVLDHLGSGLQQRRGRRLIVAILSLVMIFILLSTISVSAIYALPGSCLYPAKLRMEETHILLTLDPIAKAKLTRFYHQRQIEDLQTAVELGRLSEVDAQATITAMPTAVPTNQ